MADLVIALAAAITAASALSNDRDGVGVLHRNRLRAVTRELDAIARRVEVIQRQRTSHSC